MPPNKGKNMNRFLIMIGVLALAGCGTMFTNSNQIINIKNDSGDAIYATTENGKLNIPVGSSVAVKSYKNVPITSKNAACQNLIIEREPNFAAIVLDIFPGILIGVLPFFIDALTGNLYQLPESYVYTCE